MFFRDNCSHKFAKWYKPSLIDIVMYMFLRNFIRRGFAATFSYHSWQVPYYRFKPLCDATLFTIILFLTIGLII